MLCLRLQVAVRQYLMQHSRIHTACIDVTQRLSESPNNGNYIEQGCAQPDENVGYRFSKSQTEPN